MTHAELVETGRSWLSKRCPVVVSELSSSAGECPDVIGFNGRVHDIGFGTHLIECKISLSDFRADAKKLYRHRPELGMGDYRYYLAEKGLIKNVPEKWGLLEVVNGRIHIVIYPQRQESDKGREITLLVSTLRRLNISDGDHCSLRVKSYTIPTKNTAMLEMTRPIGQEVGR